MAAFFAYARIGRYLCLCLIQGGMRDDAPHLVCRTCSAVTHLDTDTFTKVRQLVSGSTGFDLEHGHFAWSARCAVCAAGTD